MPPRNSSRGARTSVKARKPSAGKVASVDASTPPPSSAPASVPPTPRAARISPRKRELPADAPAVQISDLAPSPAPSRRLSFGTIDVDDDVDIDSEEVDASPKKQRHAIGGVVSSAEGGDHPAPSLSFGTVDALVEEGEVASPSPKRGRRSARKVVRDDEVALEATPHTPSKPLGSKHRHESLTPTLTPSPSPPSTVKASKASLSAKDRKQANPAKRIRPMACLDSADLVAASAPVDIPPPKRAPPSSQAQAASNEDVDELWPDTPKPARAAKSLVLELLDLEAEEGTDGDDEMDVGGEDTDEVGGLSGWLDDSPPPKPVGVKGKGKALSSTPAAPVFASVTGPAANALGDNTPVAASAHDDDAIFYIDSDIDEVVEEASEPTDKATDLQAEGQHEELLNELVFASIPPILSGLVDYLRSSGFLRNIHYGELVPKYTANNEEEAKMPFVTTVFRMMKSEYSVVSIFDAIHFRGIGVYANPFTSDPKAFEMKDKKVVFKVGVNRGYPVVFVMPIVVHECNLLSPTLVNENFGTETHRWLTGWVFAELWELFSSFVTSLLNKDTAYAYITSRYLRFASRQTTNSKGGGLSVPSTPGRSAQDSLAFGDSSQRTPRRVGARSALDIKYPHVYGPHDTIPVYDGRSRYGNFRLEESQWGDIANLPRLGTPPVSAGKPPKDVKLVEMASSTSKQFSVALVAFTIGTFGTSPQVSFNLMFSILMGNWSERPEQTAFNVSLDRMAVLRAQAAAAARQSAADRVHSSAARVSANAATASTSRATRR
ncbi:hypothetical protein EYR40_002332 [Pleurotus pulmonarius]|nr:hypothetical protein EYR40_002332 [Pleurotus pulmonarius]